VASRAVNGLRGRFRALTSRWSDRYVHRMPPRSAEDYATHLPVLIAIPALVAIVEVVEFGSGVHSTPLFLDRRVYPDLTRLHSFETDSTWAERVELAAGSDPRLTLTLVRGAMAQAAAETRLESASLILLDDSVTEPDRCRTIEAVARRRPSAVVVIHDFEVPSYRRAAHGFRYSYRFASVNPNVGVLWNERGRMDKAALRGLDRQLRAVGPNLPLLDRDALKALVGRAHIRG
jgi:hypothetical protein